MRRILSLSVILCVLFLITIPSVSGADTLPALPAQYFGTVTADSGAALPAGLILIAKLGDEKYTIALKNNGVFGGPGTFGEKLMISPDTTPADKTISFWIGNTQAKETETYQAGIAKMINLTISLPKVSVQNQNAPTLNGREVFSGDPVIICSNEIPANFQIVVSKVSADQQGKLPSLPKDTKSILFADITFVNPPAAPYTVIYPFTLQKSDLTGLGIEKTDVIVLRNTGSAWEELTPVLKKEHDTGAVDYEIRMSSSSVYLIAAKTASTNPGSGSGSGGTSSGNPGTGSGSGSGGGGGGGGSSVTSAPQTTIPTATKTQGSEPTPQPVTTATTVPAAQQGNEFPLIPVIIGSIIAVVIVIGVIAVRR